MSVEGAFVAGMDAERAGAVAGIAAATAGMDPIADADSECLEAPIASDVGAVARAAGASDPTSVSLRPCCAAWTCVHRKRERISTCESKGIAAQFTV